MVPVYNPSCSGGSREVKVQSQLGQHRETLCQLKQQPNAATSNHFLGHLLCCEFIQSLKFSHGGDQGLVCALLTESVDCTVVSLGPSSRDLGRQQPEQG